MECFDTESICCAFTFTFTYLDGLAKELWVVCRPARDEGQTFDSVSNRRKVLECQLERHVMVLCRLFLELGKLLPSRSVGTCRNGCKRMDKDDGVSEQTRASVLV